jgi:hypothetical protein
MTKEILRTICILQSSTTMDVLSTIRKLRKEDYGCTVQDVYIAGNKRMDVLRAMRTLASKTTMNVLCTMHATPSKMRRHRTRRRDSAGDRKEGHGMELG